VAKSTSKNGVLKWVAGIAIAVVGISFARNAVQLSKKLIVELALSWQDLSIKVGVTIKNPSSLPVTIKYPTVSVRSGNNIISSSSPNGQVLEIKGNNQVYFPILLGFNAVALLQSAPDVYNALKTGGTIQATTVIDYGIVTSLGVQELQEVIVKPLKCPKISWLI
jgi:hypothetical protein